MGEPLQRLHVIAFLFFGGLFLYGPVVEGASSVGDPETDAVVAADVNLHSLVITELFHARYGELEGLTYLEIYNTTGKPIVIEDPGVDISGTVVRSEVAVVIGPWQMALLTNREVPGAGSSQILLPLPDLSADGGRIDIYAGTTRMTGAKYGPIDGVHALELARVLDVREEGVTPNLFQQARESFHENYYGSPGRPGSTRRLFIHELEGSDWKVLSLPGDLVDVIGDEVGQIATELSELLPGQGLPVSGTATKMVRLLVEDRQAGIVVERRVQDEERSWFLLGNPFLKPFPMTSATMTGGRLASQSFQLWNSEESTFEIVDPDGILQPWQALAVKNLNASSIRMVYPDNNQGGMNFRQEAEPSRSIRFSLHHQDLVDRAATLYFHSEGSQGTDSLEVEKLWPLFNPGPDSRSSILFFLDRTGDTSRPLSRDVRPYDLQSRFEVHMGHLHSGVYGDHRLVWDEMKNIPSDWDISIVDLQSGNRMNLREESEMVFQVTDPGIRFEQREDSPAIYPVVLTENDEPRFLLTVDPGYAPSLFSEHSAGSDKVELYPNFPNPFNLSTTVEFYLPEEMFVQLSVYNIVGQRVGRLMEGPGAIGRNQLVWDATEMPSGIYIVRLETPAGILTRKMTLIK